MTKNECISIFNKLTRGGAIEQYVALISNYLEEIKCNKSRELV